jgi:transcriptional regulator with XRE-family HTH domain
MKKEIIDENKKKKIASRIKQVRKVLKLKQKELASRLDVSGATLCETEAGKHYPGCEFLINIHRVFNVNLDFLLFGKGKMFSETEGWEKTFGGIEDLAWIDDEIRNFLYYFERSSILRHHMLIQFKTLLLKEKDLIETELKEYEEPKNKDQNESG